MVKIVKLFMASHIGSSATLSAVIPLLVTVYVVYTSLSQKLRRAKLPPGPAGWPILGNMLDVPKSGAEWIHYRNMGEKYSLSARSHSDDWLIQVS